MEVEVGEPRASTFEKKSRGLEGSSRGRWMREVREDGVRQNA